MFHCRGPCRNKVRSKSPCQCLLMLRVRAESSADPDPGTPEANSEVYNLPSGHPGRSPALQSDCMSLEVSVHR